MINTEGTPILKEFIKDTLEWRNNSFQLAKADVEKEDMNQFAINIVNAISHHLNQEMYSARLEAIQSGATREEVMQITIGSLNEQ